MLLNNIFWQFDVLSCVDSKAISYTFNAINRMHPPLSKCIDTTMYVSGCFSKMKH